MNSQKITIERYVSLINLIPKGRERIGKVRDLYEGPYKV